MQVALVSGAYREKAVLEAVNLAIRNARRASVPIIFVQHNHASFAAMIKGSKSWEIHPRLERQPDDLIIEKEASDEFYETELENRLTELGVTILAICGMQSEYCVDTTCRSALNRDFDVVLIADGHTTGPSYLPASDIIMHHNTVLPNLAHPKAKLRAITAGEIDFDDLSAFA
jgi:nicotinamidase-related amidase